MSLSPLFNLPVLIQFHIAFATVGLLLGPLVIYRQRRDRVHKVIGYMWVSAMLGVAGTGALIPAHTMSIVGHWGPIHAFVILTVWSLWTGIRAIYRRDVQAHKAAMQGLYWQGLAIAGLFTFLPGRTLNRVLFPDAPELGWVIIPLGGVGLLVVALRQRRASVQTA